MSFSGNIVPEEKSTEQVAGMFNSIAGKYDFLNHFLSLHIDKIWRKKAIRFLKSSSPQKILDIATGTGDLAIASLRLKPLKVVGIDISEKMIQIGKEKVSKIPYGNKIEFVLAQAEKIPFEENSFDAVISGFGVRNFSDLNEGLKEANRVLKPGGPLVILEFSKPSSYVAGTLYKLYFSKILPVLGGWISGDRNAYVYLPQSVKVFSEGKEFLAIMQDAGFKECSLQRLTFGICTIYRGYKMLKQPMQ
jgi:demethylmenaquinone methyltransferase / 2-methoxy-6-polyprenyl-1,4-benzoquinol methylase